MFDNNRLVNSVLSIYVSSLLGLSAKPTSQGPGRFLLFGLNQKVNKTLVRLLTESSRLLWRCSFPFVFIGILRVILEQVLDFPWVLPKKLHGNSTSKNAIDLQIQCIMNSKPQSPLNILLTCVNWCRVHF